MRISNWIVFVTLLIILSLAFGPSVAAKSFAGLNSLSGQWELLDKDGSPYVWMNLSQSGNKISGRARYETGSAQVSGEVFADRLILNIIYDNPEVLTNWLNEKVSAQAVGLTSMLDLKPASDPNAFEGHFYGFWIRWDGSYRVIQKFGGGSEEAKKKSPPKPRTLRRIAAKKPLASGPSLQLDKEIYRPAEKIRVNFSAPSNYARDAWIGIIPAAVPHGSETRNDQHDLAYQYLRNRTTGQLTFTAPSAPGTYDIRMHDTDSNGTEVASMMFQVSKSGQSSKTLPPQGHQPKDRASWIDYITSGAPFVVVFDQINGKFDDSTYTGSWQTDPMGTLKGGETYRITYANGKFTCSGYNQQQGRSITHTSKGVRPEDGVISLWGRTYMFDNMGRVWDPDYGIVGHLKTDNQKSASVSSTVKQRPVKDAQNVVQTIPSATCVDKAKSFVSAIRTGDYEKVRAATTAAFKSEVSLDALKAFRKQLLDFGAETIDDQACVSADDGREEALLLLTNSQGFRATIHVAMVDNFVDQCIGRWGVK